MCAGKAQGLSLLSLQIPLSGWGPKGFEVVARLHSTILCLNLSIIRYYNLLVCVQGSKPSQRPPSTVESLLMQNGMKHFLNLLITNGYDDIQFLAEVPEEELQEIGISQPGDRAKVC